MRTLLITLFAFILIAPTSAQKADSTQRKKVYHSYREALKQPLNVYRIDLSKLPIDSFPLDLSKFTNLEHLYLNYDHLEFIPKEIGDLQNLKVLQLNGDDFKTLPMEFSKLQNLEEVHLNSDKKMDLEQSVNVLSMLPKLTTLHLEGDGLSVLPSNFSKLSHLKNLYLNNNDFKIVPLQIKDIKTMMYLDMRSNQLPAYKANDYKTFGFKINF